MNNIIILKLPMPPTANHQYGKSGNFTYLKPEINKFRNEVKSLFLNSAYKDVKLSGFLSAEVLLIFNNKRANDIDNRLKCLFDGLIKSNIIEDDKFIIIINAKKSYNKLEQSCFIKITGDQEPVNNQGLYE
jgi:crossover junction endodeoxyribonuclease RusA